MLMKKTNALVVSVLLLILPVFSAFAARKTVVRTGIEVLEERGFAAPGGADQRGDAALRHGHIDVVQCLRGTVP